MPSVPEDEEEEEGKGKGAGAEARPTGRRTTMCMTTRGQSRCRHGSGNACDPTRGDRRRLWLREAPPQACGSPPNQGRPPNWEGRNGLWFTPCSGEAYLTSSLCPWPVVHPQRGGLPNWAGNSSADSTFRWLPPDDDVDERP